MRVLLSWLKEYVDIDIEYQDLAEKLTMAGLEVEDIKKEKFSEKEDIIFSIKVPSNRGDCLSIYGIAREISAILNKKLKKIEFSFKESKIPISDLAKLEINDYDKCPRYSCRIIKNVKVGTSPKFIQDKILACGARPINNIVDITNYICFEIGQPLHAFDYDTLVDKTIIVRCAEELEKITTLDGTERLLCSDNLVIADKKRAVAVAGIIGGLDTEITERTKNILLESAHFKPESIRKTSKMLGVTTESSYRFERWVDPSQTVFSLNRAVDLILKTAGGEVAEGVIDIYQDKFSENEILFRTNRCYFILGNEIKKQEIKDIFENLQFKVSENNGNFKVIIPTHRKDITEEIDLIEEVARIYGYNNINTTLPSGNITIGKQLQEQDIEDKIRNFFVSYGLNEVITHSLSSSELYSNSKFCDLSDKQIVLKNPMVQNYNMLRGSLLPSLLDVVKYNFSQQTENIQIFEIGKVYFKRKQFEEIKVIAGCLCGDIGRNKWSRGKKIFEINFLYLKGLVEEFLENIGIFNFEIIPSLSILLHPFFSLDFKIGDIIIGKAGEIHPQILEEWDIKQKIYYFEFTLPEILKFIKRDIKYTPYSKFPAVERDIAIVVDKKISSLEVIKTIKNLNLDILESVEIFDEYKGVQIPQDKKSLALTLKYRSFKKTLSSEEIEKLQDVILKELQEKISAQIRKE